ncbi:MAG: cupin domain-containing protein [Acidimicrobiales bacterium]
MTDRAAVFDLSKTYVHLGLGAVALPVQDFSWEPAFLERYARETELDGPEGRLVCITSQEATWASWERHPAGDELVLQLSGRSVLVQEVEGGERRYELSPGQAIINPRNVWHTSDVTEPGSVLFVTPGAGTQHRLR